MMLSSSGFIFRIFFRVDTINRLLGNVGTHLSSHMTSHTRVLISPYPDLLPDIFCLTVRIFRLMLVLLYIYIYIYIYITNIPPIMIINRIYGNQNFLSL